MLVIDTDVLIDYLRGLRAAAEFMKSRNEPMSVSSIGVAELYAGVREGRERAVLEAFCAAFEIIPVTAALAQTGGLWRRDYGPSHGVGLADAIIAATAVEQAATLVTLNHRHYPMVRNLLIPYAK